MIAIWQRAAASLSSYSRDENLVRETLLKKVQRLLSQLKKKLMTGSAALEKYKTTLEELQEKVSFWTIAYILETVIVSKFILLVDKTAIYAFFLQACLSFSVSHQG